MQQFFHIAALLARSRARTADALSEADLETCTACGVRSGTSGGGRGRGGTGRRLICKGCRTRTYCSSICRLCDRRGHRAADARIVADPETRERTKRTLEEAKVENKRRVGDEACMLIILLCNRICRFVPFHSAQMRPHGISCCSFLLLCRPADQTLRPCVLRLIFPPAFVFLLRLAIVAFLER
ncbi:unnamed protein product [Phaeothamnion confervicola]